MRKLPKFQTERLASEDWLQFRSLETLPAVAGVPSRLLVRLALKEATDNALDSIEQEIRTPGGARVHVKEDNGTYMIADEGPGIDPAEVPELFSMRRPRSTSRRWRLPFRGVLGNGLRVLVGLVYASSDGAELVVETRGHRLALAPQPDGSTKVLSDEASQIKIGTVVRVCFGARAHRDGAALLWAEQAIEASRTGAIYRGLPSPHWFDAGTWADLLAMVDRPLREIVAGFDGCSGAKAGRVVDALGFKGRTASSLDESEAVLVLSALQGEAEPAKPRRLGAIGKRDGVPGYGRADGTFASGSKRPCAKIPYVVEAWVEQISPRNGPGTVDALLVNRSPVPDHPLTFGAEWTEKNSSALIGCGVALAIATPGRGAYRVALAVTTPFMPIATSGKQPLLGDFRDGISGALEKAIRGARRAFDQEPEPKPRRSRAVDDDDEEPAARITIKESIFNVLAQAIEHSADGGFRFPQRNLFYEVRRLVLARFGPLEMRFKTFCSILTDYENDKGPIPAMVRDARGTMTVPHGGGSVDLGTVGVEDFARPLWTFNKALVIEKEGIADVLIAASWHQRHDCAILGGKGYATRALRDLLDGFAGSDEPLKVFALRDADANGTHIFETLVEATPARGRRRIRIVDLGLQPWEAIKMGLEIETFPKAKQRRPVAAYVRRRRDKAPGGLTWEDWLQTHRIELNALRTKDLIAWLDAKMVREPGKVIPPDSVTRPTIETAVREGVATWARKHLLPDLAAAILRRELQISRAFGALERHLAPQLRELDDLRQRRDETIAASVEEIIHLLALPDTAEMIANALAEEPESLWSDKLNGVAAALWSEISPLHRA